MKKFIDISCERKDKKFTIKIKNDGQSYTIYYSNKAEINDKTKKLITSNKSEIEILDPVIGKRTYFIVKMDGYEDEIFAERKLPLKGSCNFRDLGGFRTADDKRVKWNKFYRSDALNILTNEDIKYLEDLGLKGILDFRAKGEAEYEKDLEIKGAMYFNAPAMRTLEDDDESMKGNFNMEFLFKNLDKIPQMKDPTRFMITGYESMVFENKAFKKMIDMMKEDKDIPFVQHCKSGKDRTGIGSALILLLLGVDMDVVKNDYLASNFYRKLYNDKVKDRFKQFMVTEESEEIFSFMMEVKEEYFDATFKYILTKYDDLDEYFKVEYSLTEKEIKELKEYYLY
ncbi:tyrosine-protein phosphatase [uncultured Clostridium sp.]|uniref:tyrosine-protein phosphatase n=1 Tax=uncultured Clostridium sp. TaxID=59620 RepID=UPI00262B8253|nr:tyrosine-protein phosphatase [uncultured Clostridium sp.]